MARKELGGVRVLKVVIGTLLLSLSTLVYSAESNQLEPGGVNPGFEEKPAWFKSSFLDLPEDVADAAEQGKRLMLYFYQDGCPYCSKLLRDNFGEPAVAEATRSRYEVIAINIWGDREVTTLDGRVTTEKVLAEELRVMYTPTLLLLDEQGATRLRLNGYYPPTKFLAALDYAAATGEGGSFRDYLQRVTPARTTGQLHAAPFFMSPPYQLSRKGFTAERPLLVIFEQQGCVPCDEQHTTLYPREDVRALLAKFDVVRFDMWANTPLVTPSGRRMRAKTWAQELGVAYAPSMLFFDRRGQEVFRVEAYLRPFHTLTALEYVASEAYLTQPNFQRYVQSRADRLREAGETVDLWN